ncbi:unnamed protein product [Cuscuta campestris]|uniref:histidine kinase n=1 Tax=Cuscuta campestris TaxID=132261 RepID=A0A484KYK2_9ASTE|nr:unnamed protein product [Cuscuta campestris]
MNACMTVGCVVGFTCWSVTVTRREMWGRAERIRQMEAAREAERKSMRKIDAFAGASHEVRTALAGITGLIHMCRAEVPPGSSLDFNLNHIDSCTNDLKSLLNSILDTSKIESGKMQVEEEEFDLQQVLEDVVDLYYPVGMEKGVDVILDPCDGSVEHFREVKGDRGKLKQILCNLLYNSIKFTDQGHVSLRAWAVAPKHPTTGGGATSIHNRSGNGRPFSFASRLLFGSISRGKAAAAAATETGLLENSGRDDVMEYVFEVVDTGRGIPKEKHKFVFENYVQVKETSASDNHHHGHLGHGLGLGIVRSLVHLMGGEIGIIDKEIGEKGTCFRFNIFLGNPRHPPGNSTRQDIESSPCIYGSKCWPSSRVTSQVVLFIQSEERSEIARRFLKNRGIKVTVITKGYQQLSKTLKKIRSKLFVPSKSGQPTTSNSQSSASSTPSSSRSRSRSKEVVHDAKDGARDTMVLMIVDTRAGPFPEVSRTVAEFQRDLLQLGGFARVVWIDISRAHDNREKLLLPSTDLVMSKPLHGSSLNRILELLPEFASSTKPSPQSFIPSGEIQVVIDKEKDYDECGPSTRGDTAAQNKPLQGKRILIVDDTLLQRRICIAVVSQLGAQSYTCDNGAEAVELVTEALQNWDNKHTFDYILMDCEMPVMDGFVATMRIKEKGEAMGIQIPIIALTAHTGKEEMDKITGAGMDYYLPKPLTTVNLLTAIQYLDKA